MQNQDPNTTNLPISDERATPPEADGPAQVIEANTTAELPEDPAPGDMVRENTTLEVRKWTTDPSKPLTEYFANTYGFPQDAVISTIAATCFKGKAAERAKPQQLMMFMAVAKQYGLNPFLKEIYAFPDDSNGITPIVGVDGFLTLAMRNPAYISHDYVYAEKLVPLPGTKADTPGAKMVPEWIECHVTVNTPTGPKVHKVREYFDECYREPFKGKDGYVKSGPWQSHPRRMLRHKATIQALRIAVGLHGIYDEDEAERMITPDPLPADLQAAAMSSRIGDGLQAAGIKPVDDEPAGQTVDVTATKVEE